MHFARWLAIVALILAGLPARALEPKDVFLLVNRNVPASQVVADHYCQKRGVPKANVIVLDLPTGEDISRRDYDSKLVTPLRAALKDRREQVNVLLSIYGVPLRVGPADPTPEEQKEMARLRNELEPLQARLRALQEEIGSLEAKAKKQPSDAVSASLRERRTERDRVQQQTWPLDRRLRVLSHAESHACVDSELSHLWWEPYELRRWQVNLLNFQVPEKVRKQSPPLVMVARLDGPTPEIAMRLVDQAVAVEQKGLTGKVYVDARGIGYDPKHDTGYGYGGYDESLREMARLLKNEAKLPVVLDDRPELFAVGSCPDCALYCGWYSLSRYVDCCRFVPGAVAYHIASSEAVSLRDPKCSYWCKCLLEHGVAATLGPVAEPYTIGFPKPAEFFGFLVTGRYTLVECYYRTALLTSWMTVLVGDPLYNPFARHPRLRPAQVRPSPKNGKFFLHSSP
jgi:uncharacterized protein (TIGR03790 family)